MVGSVGNGEWVLDNVVDRIQGAENCAGNLETHHISESKEEEERKKINAKEQKYQNQQG